ncbi:hypothetical protein BFW01_g1044 [Lasiodiplodia theobromae]|uniref:Nephrocystin 3-like N-terminal domain-containing protein n=1 Tax=Lasiodiplodia theobromae TaxID=45133 RepID=A0A8H7ISK7_9PEZI|nr:hypothetical protein BFW01_g1044 [Lasiodiplodia theobromae]
MTLIRQQELTVIDYRSRVIDWLDHLGKERSIYLLYFYIDFGNDQQIFMHNLLSTFCDQIGRNNLPETLKKGIGKRPIDEDQRALFEFLAKTERPVYIIVDALDQLNNKNRTWLLEAFNGLLTQCQSSQGKSRVLLLVSSRDYRGLQGLQAHGTLSIKVEVEDSVKDIRRYLENELETSLLPELPDQTRRSVKNEVLKKLTKHASGMFLWVELQAANICKDNQTEVGVLNDLKHLTLPGKMKEMYEKIAQGFELNVGTNSGQGTTGNDKEIARRTTSLLAHAAQSIPLGALAVAVALETKDGNPNENLVTRLKTTPSIIVQACKHLVELDEELRVFRFRHASIYDFFRGTRKSAEENQNQLQDIIVELCEKPENMQLSFQVYLFTLGRSLTTEICHAHILSHFGLIQFFEIFHEKGWLDPRRRDGDGLTAVHWAIRSETETIDAESDSGCTAPLLEKLIKHGGQKDAQDNKGRTPLYYASRYGKLDAVKLLLKERAKVDLRSRRYGSALLAACYNHHEPIIKELLEAGADVNMKSSFGTPLHAIASIGCRNCAELLLKKRRFFTRSPRVDVYGGYFGTALHAAAYNGRHEVVRLLLEKGFDASKMSETLGSTLTAAAAGCYESWDPTRFVEVFRLLLEYGVDVNAQGGTHGTALHAAATFGHEILVGLLLDQNADVTAAGRMGTAYIAAKDGGYDKIMKLLVEKDPNVANADGNAYNRPFASDGPDESVETPLHQCWVRLFKFAVATNDRLRIVSMISAAIKVFERSIKEDQNNVVAGMASVGEAIFEAVISLTTEGQAGEPERPSMDIIQAIANGLRAAKENLKGKLVRLCEGLGLNMVIGADENRISDRPRLPPRRDSAYEQDGLEGSYPYILDQLTQAAVAILECALANDNIGAVTTLAKIWTQALYKVMSCSEKMLQVLVQNRAAQLKKIMINDDLKPHQRLEQAKRLTEVAIELLVTALRRGRDNGAYRLLASSLANLWVSALEDVLHLGGRRRAEVRQLVQTFAQKFQAAVDRTDKESVYNIADAAIEMLRMTALNRSNVLMEVLATMWVDKLAAAMGRKVLKAQIDRLIMGRAEEYRECINRGKRSEALGLAAASMGFLDAAISQHLEAVSQTLTNTIATELEWTVDNTKVLQDMFMDILDTRDVDSTDNCSKSQSQPLDLMAIFDLFSKIITVAKRENRLTDLDNILRAVLKSFEKIPSSICETLNNVLGQCVWMSQQQDASKTRAENFDPRLELRLEQSSTAVATLLHMALQGHTVPATLTNMGITLLGEIRKKGNTEHDMEVIRFLEEQERYRSKKRHQSDGLSLAPRKRR